MNHTRFQTQLAFLAEIDRLKEVFRRTYLLSETRRENDAEHSWHLAMYVLLLAEHAPGEIDLLRPLQIVLIHDLVEIDAGDTFLYDEQARRGQKARETQRRASPPRWTGCNHCCTTTVPAAVRSGGTE